MIKCFFRLVLSRIDYTYPLFGTHATPTTSQKQEFNALISSSIIKHLADAIIAISEDEMDRFEDFARLSVINNSIQPDQIHQAISSKEQTREKLGLKLGELGVGFIGSLSEIRGAWDFIRAAGMVKQKHPDYKIKYFLVGKIPAADTGGIRAKFGLAAPQDALEFARELGIQVNILEDLIFTGHRPDALDVMAAMDVIVVYSKMGVMGRPPFESMALGVPVIVSAGHSGKSTVVIDGKTGLVIPPSNPEMLAEVLIKLANNPSLRKCLSENGKEHAQVKFSPNINAQKVMSIYQALILKGA